MACIYTLPRVLQLRTLPPYRGGLRCCHVPPGSGLCLPAQEGSSAAMCHMALDPASVLEMLWCYHVSHESGASTCHMALDPASLIGRALVLPCASRLQSLPPYSGGLQCYHVSRNP
jgi:hypothetical protein